MHEITFWVRGSGTFPVAMLSEEACFPVMEENALLMDVIQGQREICLRTVRDTQHWQPQRDRWLSHGWEVAVTMDVDGEVYGVPGGYDRPTCVPPDRKPKLREEWPLFRATVHILIQAPGVEDHFGACDWFSGLLRDHDDVFDWSYLAVASEDFDGHGPVKYCWPGPQVYTPDLSEGDYEEGQGFIDLLPKPAITPEDLRSALALSGGEPPKPDGTNQEEIDEWNRLTKLAESATSDRPPDADARSASSAG